MKMKTLLVLASILTLVLVAGSTMAGDPMKEDEEFLESDPDMDYIPTWMEFILGTDPYNSDSDNDGLPDHWEYENEMDPADASDAHKDYDYLPNINEPLGERDCGLEDWDDEVIPYQAIMKDIDVWPSNREITFTGILDLPDLKEDDIHYDNYEEYYRPYHDQNDDMKIKILKTKPCNPDTDDDGLLDPDDFEPLNYKNDGTGAGGADNPIVLDNTDIKQDIAQNIDNKIQQITPLIPLNENFDLQVQNNYEINVDKPTQDENKAVDMDNDGI